MKRDSFHLPGLVGAAGAAVLMAACGADDRARVAAAGEAPPQCASRAQGSRWASAGAYAETAAYGTDEAEHWLGDIGGVASLDGLVFVYDAGRARVVALDDALRPVRVFGREGKGPGELQPERDMGWRGRGWRWLDVADGSLAVFDGTRIQLFSPDGTVAGEGFRGAIRSGVVTFETDRLRYWDGTLVAAAGGYRPDWRKGARPNEWTLYRSGGRRADAILSLPLTPRPTSPGGVPFTGPEQAIPVWDMANGCILAGDGTRRPLLRSDIEGRQVDTLAIDLPDLGRPRVDVEKLERLMGMAGKGRSGGYVRPSAPRMIEAISIDPDGYAWILPVQDSAAGGEGIEILRLSLGSGVTQRDTVPAFPIAFGSPGVFFARAGDREQPTLVRYQVAAGERAAP
jgi:hypothetical protein